MNIDGMVKNFAEFNSGGCSRGYLYFNQKDQLRIAIMPPKRLFDTPWPLQKIPFKETGKHEISMNFFETNSYFSSSYLMLSC